MNERIVAPITVPLSEETIRVLKSARFFTKWTPDWRSYISGQDNGAWNVGESLTFRHRIRIEPYSAIYSKYYKPSLGQPHSHGLCSIGFQSYSYSPLPEELSIGRYCSISSGVLFLDACHPTNRVSSSHFSHKPGALLARAAVEDKGEEVMAVTPYDLMEGRTYPIIQDDVWVGQDALLVAGITLGTGCVVAANAVVTKSVPPYAIVGGNPAKIIRYRFSDEIVAALLASKWWQFHFSDFREIPLQHLPSFLEKLSSQAQRGAIKPYRPRPLILPDDIL